MSENKEVYVVAESIQEDKHVHFEQSHPMNGGDINHPDNLESPEYRATIKNMQKGMSGPIQPPKEPGK